MFVFDDQRQRLGARDDGAPLFVLYYLRTVFFFEETLGIFGLLG